MRQERGVSIEQEGGEWEVPEREWVREERERVCGAGRSERGEGESLAQ